MKNFEFTPYEGTDGRVVAYLHTPIVELPNHRRLYPSVIVCPGGGYQFCSEREADPVALEYLAAGYNVFILYYSLKDRIRHFNPLKELSSTVMAIRDNGDEWGCDPDKIAVCGFSAGGHLAASLCTLWNHPDFLADFDNKGGLNRPNAAIISYAVITSEVQYRHGGSIDTISGVDSGDMKVLFSLEKQVGEHCCPSFVWHTADDAVVPVENSLMFITALQQHKVPFEAHIFPSGSHGISVCTNEVASKNNHVGQWVELSKRWLACQLDYVL